MFKQLPPFFLMPQQNSEQNLLVIKPTVTCFIAERLEPGKSINRTLGVDFCDTTQPLSFDLW